MIKNLRGRPPRHLILVLYLTTVSFHQLHLPPPSLMSRTSSLRPKRAKKKSNPPGNKKTKKVNADINDLIILHSFPGMLFFGYF